MQHGASAEASSDAARPPPRVGTDAAALRFDADSAQGVEWSPDARTLLFSGGRAHALCAHDAETGERRWALAADSGEVMLWGKPEWSPCARYIAARACVLSTPEWTDRFACGLHRYETWLLDAASGRRVRTVRARSHADHCVCWSPCGRMLAFANALGDIEVCRADADAGAPEPRDASVLARGAAATAVAWSPCGRWIVVAAAGRPGDALDSTHVTVRVCDARTGETVRPERPCRCSGARLCLLPCGRRVVLYAYRDGDRPPAPVVLDLADPAGDVRARGDDFERNSLAVSPCGRWLAATTRGGGVAFCDTGTGARACTLPAAPGERFGAAVLRWSPDGRALVVLAQNGKARVLAVPALE